MKPSILLVGCGRLGGAILDGWLASKAIEPASIAIQSPSMKPAIERALRAGSDHNPVDTAGVRTVVLAVKPAKWRDATTLLAAQLSPDAVVLSVMAGVRSSALMEAFGERPLARLMPTTAVSVCRGVAGWWSDNADAALEAQRLFRPIAELVRLDHEDLIDVATAVSGSGAAYVYAFVRALTRAGVARGLTFEQALTLARQTSEGAIARLHGTAAPDELIAEVASPGGTTQAGLAVLEPGLTDLVDATVDAALSRAREMAAQ